MPKERSKEGHLRREFLGEDVLDLTPAEQREKQRIPSMNQVCALRNAKFHVEDYRQLGAVPVGDVSQES